MVFRFSARPLRGSLREATREHGFEFNDRGTRERARLFYRACDTLSTDAIDVIVISENGTKIFSLSSISIKFLLSVGQNLLLRIVKDTNLLQLQVITRRVHLG